MKDLPYPSGARSADADTNALFFVSLGGAGEIGMNLNLYGYAGDWLILDCGVTFGDDSQPGLEVVMPDPAFIVERRDRLLGIVATHAHEDHIGAIPYLWTQLRCPVWATPFTASLLRAKLVEAGLADKVRINVVPMSGRFTIGPFDLELITLTHSIPEPNAVALRTPVGTVLHTGDWKFDPDPLIGSTSDEADLRRSLIDLVGRYDARVAVACFASNVARLETIARAATVHGREVALVGRSLWRIDKAARENGYLADLPRFLTEDEAGYIPRDKIVLICTGSQGEPRAALARIAREDHPNIVLETGDVVIFSSRIIPGNEKAINRLQNALVRLGIEIITEEDHFVHVSGHPARDELVRMYQMVRPRVAIPVHGEARHLIAHAHLAEECQVEQPLVIQNGDMVQLTPSGAAIVDEVPVGRLASDGKSLLPLGGAALKDRRRIILNGSAVATLVVDRQGRLAAPPAISLIGLVEETAASAALPFLSDAAECVLDDLPAGARRDDNAVRDAVRRTLRRAINERFGKRPLIELHLVRV